MGEILTAVEKMKFKNLVNQVLHMPGNFTQPILEMAIVLDCSIEKEKSEQITKEIVRFLKGQGELFQNIRLNTIRWEDTEAFRKEITPVPSLFMGRYFDSYAQMKKEKEVDELLEMLKKFYARSKLVLFITNGNFHISDKRRVSDSLRPFLSRKLIWIFTEKNKDTVLEPVKIHVQNRIMEICNN